MGGKRTSETASRESTPGWCRLNWRSALLFPTTDPRWRWKVGVGGLVLLIPVIGWVTALGYRKEAIFRLIRRDAPVLPDWRGNGIRFLVEGLKALAVINAYYVPIYLWLGIRLTDHPAAEHIPWGWMTAIALTAPIFSTLVVPATLAADQFLSPDPAFGWAELAGIAAAYAVATFVIPSGFLNVSRTGRIVSALDLPRATARIARHPREYTEAWVGSGLISLAGHFSGVFAPWGVVWCYLSIVYAFNDMPLAAGDSDSADLERSWFATFRRSGDTELRREDAREP